MRKQLEYIEYLLAKGGPDLEDYPNLDQWAAETDHLVQSGEVNLECVRLLRAVFGEVLSTETLQGFALAKPHGYAGDFEIIDRIYREHVSSVPHLAKWDVYWQQQAAPRAVRNRKTYFHQLLRRRESETRRELRVLNVASGPGRDMFEYFSAHPDSQVRFHCVEQDPNAIQFCRTLCRDFLDRIDFEPCNAVRFRPRERYDLVWSAGLFDYFNDRIFEAVLKRLWLAVAPGGELVIGNFAPGNSTRPWMDLGEWNLHYRTADDLLTLARSSGTPDSDISVGQEPQGLNLFVHIRRSETE